MKKRLLDLRKLKFEIRDMMRYSDVGDYYGDTIISYDMKDPVITNAIFIHEFVEYTLIRSAGIASELVDKFDTDPSSREKFPKEYALYRKSHTMANRVERQFVENLGRDWSSHERAINSKKIRVVVHEISEITDEMHTNKLSEERVATLREIIKKVFAKLRRRRRKGKK